MKIQPIDSFTLEEAISYESVKPLVSKWRLRRFFECQFPSVLRSSSSSSSETQLSRNVYGGDFDPSSVCLANMVQNFIEEDSSTNEKQSTAAAPPKCSRNRCICFSRLCNNNNDSFSDDEIYSGGEACEVLKSLVSCLSMYERNLLADTANIVEKNKVICKRKDDACRKIVTDGLSALGYDASVCKSLWDKSPTFPAGEYEYIDVIVEGERLLIDIDFRSEFEIARSTKAYGTIIQTLPYIFVGKCDRLQKIIAVVTDCARLSLQKKGMHFPPWRSADYVNAKWLSPYIRASAPPPEAPPETLVPSLTFTTLIPPFGKGFAFIAGGKKSNAAKEEWKLPELKPKPKKIMNDGVKIVTGSNRNQNRNETLRRILADKGGIKKELVRSRTKVKSR